MTEESLVNWFLLQEPFASNELEWRVGNSGVNDTGPWVLPFPYVTNRAIQNRLDDVCGPQGWRNEFVPHPQGMLCGLHIRPGPDEEWICKWDGASARDFEPFKSSLSDSMKRAACQWGIGRYLYSVPKNRA
jgi:hypothetical protein